MPWMCIDFSLGKTSEYFVHHRLNEHIVPMVHIGDAVNTREPLTISFKAIFIDNNHGITHVV